MANKQANKQTNTHKQSFKHTRAHMRSGLVDQRGFLPGCHHLLPFAIYEREAGKGKPSSRRKRQKDRTCVSRLHIGYEYETAAGKRFIAHGSDATVRTTASGMVKVGLVLRVVHWCAVCGVLPCSIAVLCCVRKNARNL